MFAAPGVNSTVIPNNFYKEERLKIYGYFYDHYRYDPAGVAVIIMSHVNYAKCVFKFIHFFSVHY